LKFSYYPGCSSHSTAKEYDESVRVVSDALGIELQEIEDWSCCGASSAHMTNHKLSVALPARNIIAAEANGHDIMVLRFHHSTQFYTTIILIQLQYFP